MKTPVQIFIIAAVCMAGLISCANPHANSTSMPVSASSHASSSLADRLFDDVNAYRRSKGASNLVRHAGLDKLAQEHCQYLMQHRGSFSLKGKNVSHIGAQDRFIVAQHVYQMANVSENVASCSKSSGSTTQALITLWKNSDDHHRNMIDVWTHSGIGVAVDADGMVFATQIFATKNNSLMQTRDRFNQF